MYRIGEFSRMPKVTVKALRYYDEMGLLKPEQVDGVTGYRMYTTAQLVPLQRIVALRRRGCPSRRFATSCPDRTSRRSSASGARRCVGSWPRPWAVCPGWNLF